MENELLVTYYPEYKGKNRDMAAVSERLSECLELISVQGEPLRCGTCKHTFNKDSMSTVLSCSFFVRIKNIEEKSELMEEYKLNIKEG